MTAAAVAGQIKYRCKILTVHQSSTKHETKILSLKKNPTSNNPYMRKGTHAHAHTHTHTRARTHTHTLETLGYGLEKYAYSLLNRSKLLFVLITKSDTNVSKPIR